MKLFIRFTLCVSIAIYCISCDDDKVDTVSSGTVTLNFDNVIGEDELVLVNSGSEEYDYQNGNQQAFNLNLLGYYVSEIKLINENGEVFLDEVAVDATDSKGYYRVLESDPASQMISLSGVPSGKYTSVTFTIGVKGNTVTEGAAGGVLDPEKGAWFWSWNSGYVALRIEGASPASGAEDKSLTYHIGGWNEPNNIKELTLTLPHHLVVGNDTQSELHIHVDILKILGSLDFTTKFSVHSPSAGQPLADIFSDVFEIHHVDNGED